MKYTPRNGKFAGRESYGYKSISTFIESSIALIKEPEKLKEFDMILPTIQNTLNVTKILEAGRKSLDKKKTIFIKT